MYVIYGTSNCAGCRDAKAFLTEEGKEFKYIELNQNNYDEFSKKTGGKKLF